MHFIQQIITYIASFILSITPMTQYSEGVVGQPRSFLPSQTTTQNDKTISKLIYRGLFRYDIYGTLIPDLADTWTISDDGITYKIKLKDNQYWSDGTKINSNDLIYTAFKVTDLNGVATDKIDSLTVQYTLPNKYSPFLSLLTVGIMQQNSEENKNFLMPVSSGPFRVIDVQKSGPVVNKVTLLNNNSNENIRKLVFRYYANDDELATASQLGEIDGFLSQKKFDLPNFNQTQFPIQGVYYALFFNLRDSKFSDIEFRKKLQKVISVNDLTYSYGISTEGVVSRSVFTNRSLNFDLYDKSFKDDLGRQEVAITFPDLKNHRELAENIKKVWEDKLNLNVTLNPVETSKFEEEIVKPRKFEILLYGQETARDPDRYVNWHSTQKDYPGLNLPGFEHVRADRALEEGRNEIDNDKRVVHYNEFQRVVADQVPAIFLYHPFAKYYISKYIEGVGQKYTFTVVDRFLDFDNWKHVETN